MALLGSVSGGGRGWSESVRLPDLRHQPPDGDFAGVTPAPQTSIPARASLHDPVTCAAEVVDDIRIAYNDVAGRRDEGRRRLAHFL